MYSIPYKNNAIRFKMCRVIFPFVSPVIDIDNKILCTLCKYTSMPMRTPNDHYHQSCNDAYMHLMYTVIHVHYHQHTLTKYYI